jgi:AAA15 family ATPase/GTPase
MGGITLITYIKLRNFKSFGDIIFDLRNKSGLPKKLAIVYGENGMGKSNLVSSFCMLSETMHTMDVRDIMQQILKDASSEIPDEEFMTFIRQQFKDIEHIINENKMADSDGNLYIELGFQLEGKNGRYIIEMDNKEIVSESMEFLLLKRRGLYFSLTKEKKFLSEKIFFDKELNQNLYRMINQFWGKHSFLSLYLYDRNDKADDYYENKVSDKFNLVMHHFTSLSCKIQYGNSSERGIMGLHKNFITKYDSGKIDSKNIKILDKTEAMVNTFLTLVNKDVKVAYYKRKKVKDGIKYHLFVKKMIYGKVRCLDFNLESRGTQSIIRLLPYMLLAVNGATVVIDEFDSGVHDLLVQNLITSLNEYITGQLIITTHNTLLLESDLPSEYFYVIHQLQNYNKEIQCILKYDNKIGRKTNRRNQYFLGTYHGIPADKRIDFKMLVDNILK